MCSGTFLYVSPRGGSALGQDSGMGDEPPRMMVLSAPAASDHSTYFGKNET